MKKSTKIIRSGRENNNYGGAVNPPVIHASTITTKNYKEYINIEKRKDPEMKYGRVGTTTTFALEESIRELEEGAKSLIFSSGLSAITSAILSSVKKNSHILVTDSVYYPTRRFCNTILKDLGIEVQYFDPLSGNKINNYIKNNTSMIFLESPGSLTFEMIDVPAITKIANTKHIKVLLDNTWATPLFYQPLKHGVDLSIHSATKYISGHSDVMLGIVTANNESAKSLEKTTLSLGVNAGPDDIYLGLRGLKTLEVRLKKHQESALIIAQWLKKQPEVSKVMYPALIDDPGYDIWKRDFDGASGLFGFTLKGKQNYNIENMMNSLNLFTMGASWGGFESLCIPTWPHKYRTENYKNTSESSFRVSVGLEDAYDLIKDLRVGLDNL
ncbi:cystathionine beta-lyase [Alphaproteobacteria bacterium]|nr:cystathionine beta-lyase [Alphaproteobacteria bacterium]